MNPHNQPLEVEVVAGRLVISIGIDTLAFAADHHEEFTPYDDELGDWVQRWHVFEKGEFALEVARQMQREAEDGSTPLTRFQDKMFLSAVEDGCLGVEECPPKTPSVWKTDAKRQLNGN
jgi:hypothetical protein